MDSKIPSDKTKGFGPIEMLLLTSELDCPELHLSPGKTETSPITRVMEYFLGKDNPYKVSFADPNSWKDEWPEDIDKEYSRQELLADAIRGAGECNKGLESRYGKNNFEPVRVEGAYLNSGDLVGYFIFGLEGKQYKKSLLERTGLKKSNVFYKSEDIAFCPLGDLMELSFLLSFLLDNLQDNAELKTKLIELTRKGYSPNEITERFEDTPEIKKFMTLSTSVKEAYQHENSFDFGSALYSLILRDLGFEGNSLFGENVEHSEDKKLNLLQEMEYEGPSRTKFEGFLRYALQKESF